MDIKDIIRKRRLELGLTKVLLSKNTILKKH